MNILMAHNLYQQAGGEDQSFRAEAGLLEAFGHEVTRFTLNNDAIPELGAVQTAIRTIWSASAAEEVSALVRDHHIQVAHFQNTFPLISPAAYYAAQQGGAAVVQALRNYRLTCANALLYRDGHVCELCVGRFAPVSGIRHRCYRGSAAGSAVVAGMIGTHKLLGTYRRQVDGFIAVSEFVKEKYVRAGFDPEHIAVKPNVVSPDPGPGAGLGGYALYVGRLTEDKGIRTVLRAWAAQRPQLPLKIVGVGPLQGEVERAAGAPGIEYLGQRPLQETYDLMGEAAMLLVPSEAYEPFGRVAVEAFAKGTPVVASAMGGLTELVMSERTGLLFQSGDAADLTRQVEALTSQPQRLAEMRLAARQTYLDRYTPARNHELLMDIYERALWRRRSKRSAQPAH